MPSRAKTFFSDLLSHCDIEIDGSRPWDIQVHDDRLYQRILTQGTLGLGEAYMDGWWDVEALDDFFYRVLKADLKSKLRFDFSLAFSTLKAMIFNTQRRHVTELARNTTTWATRSTRACSMSG